MLPVIRMHQCYELLAAGSGLGRVDPEDPVGLRGPLRGTPFRFIRPAAEVGDVLRFRQARFTRLGARQRRFQTGVVAARALPQPAHIAGHERVNRQHAHQDDSVHAHQAQIEILRPVQVEQRDQAAVRQQGDRSHRQHLQRAETEYPEQQHHQDPEV